MANKKNTIKLGTVEISDDMRSGLKHYGRLEGERSVNKLIEDAEKSYIKVIQAALDKDPAIREELAKSKSPKRDVKITKIAS